MHKREKPQRAARFEKPVAPENSGKGDDWVETLQLEGRKAVLEALKNAQPIDRLLLKKEADGSVAGTLRVIAAKAKEAGVAYQIVDRAKLEDVSQSGNHQGVIALCPAKPYVSPEDILALAAERGEPPFVLVLDGITDPHNLGAILRTAEAGGVHGVIIPKRRAVCLTGAVAKTSAGAIAYVPVARVTNLSRTLADLQKQGLWVICAAGEEDGPAPSASTDLYAADFKGPLALVIGAEGEGVSRIVREKSDFVVRIPMRGKIGSLNASVAAGVLIYQALGQRQARP